MDSEQKKKNYIKMLKSEAITGLTDGGIKGSRKVLSSDVNIYDGKEKGKEENDKMKKDLEDLKSLTKKNKHAVDLQGRLLEKWINDILQDAEDFKLPGFMNKPEHIIPIVRYGLDR